MKMSQLFTFLVFAFFSGCATLPKNPWKEITTPTHAKALDGAIGSYDAGCLQGALSLNADGEGYIVMRPSRRRYYGHPKLIDFIESTGKKVHQKKLGVMLIGDLSQPRGGPLFPGHNSHQNGLDVDIWFQQPVKNKLNLDERENTSAMTVLNSAGLALDSNLWSNKEELILKTAAENPAVDRIFVDALIKKNLCQKFQGQSWMAKIRPWWNHADHFHVRLKCPDGSSQCKSQNSITPSDDCNSTLEWWFSEEAIKITEERKQALLTPQKIILPILPEACERVRTEN